MIDCFEQFEQFHKNIEIARKSIIKIKSHKMNEFGLKAANVMCLFFLGKYKDGLTPNELCSLCGEDKAGISKSLTILKRKNYVCTNDSGEKKYRIKYQITKSGEAVYSEISDYIKNAVETIGEGPTEDEINAFYETFGKFVLNFEKFCKEL